MPGLPRNPLGPQRGRFCLSPRLSARPHPHLKPHGTCSLTLYTDKQGSVSDVQQTSISRLCQLNNLLGIVAWSQIFRSLMGIILTTECMGRKIVAQSMVAHHTSYVLPSSKTSSSSLLTYPSFPVSTTPQTITADYREVSPEIAARRGWSTSRIFTTALICLSIWSLASSTFLNTWARACFVRTARGSAGQCSGHEGRRTDASRVH